MAKLVDRRVYDQKVGSYCFDSELVMHCCVLEKGNTYFPVDQAVYILCKADYSHNILSDYDSTIRNMISHSMQY